jgi:hypothetical protein
MDKVKQLLLLDVIRRTGNRVPFPVIGNWASLMDELEELEVEGYLELSENHLRISNEGKKFLMLFKSEMESELKTYDVYKDVVINGEVIDARMPILAYKTRKLKPEQQAPILKDLAIMLEWDKVVKTVVLLEQFQDNVNWQKVLFATFDRGVDTLANRYCWRVLGPTLNEAAAKAEQLLQTTKPKKLIQIER